MVTNNLKSYDDIAIIDLVDRIDNDEITYTLNDLKAMLAEVTCRKLDQQYIDILAGLIKKNISNDGAPDEKRLRRQVQTIEEKEEIYDDDYDKFPVLSLLAGIYKALGWVLIIACIVIGTILSITMFINNVLAVTGIMLTAVAVGTILVLMFYAAAESIVLKLEIEKHLRKRS